MCTNLFTKLNLSTKLFTQNKLLQCCSEGFIVNFEKKWQYSENIFVIFVISFAREIFS